MSDESPQPALNSLVVVVFHERDHRESEGPQMVGFPAVAAAVGGDLLAPPPAIAFRLDEAARASVPETPVHEHGDAVIGEHEIGSTGEGGSPRGVPYPEPTHHGTNPAFGLGVARRHPAHALGHLGGRRQGPDPGCHRHHGRGAARSSDRSTQRHVESVQPGTPLEQTDSSHSPPTTNRGNPNVRYRSIPHTT